MNKIFLIFFFTTKMEHWKYREMDKFKKWDTPYWLTVHHTRWDTVPLFYFFFSNRQVEYTAALNIPKDNISFLLILTCSFMSWSCCWSFCRSAEDMSLVPLFMRGPVGPGTTTPVAAGPDTTIWPAVLLLLLPEAAAPTPAPLLPPLLLLLLLLAWLVPGRMEAGAGDSHVHQ